MPEKPEFPKTEPPRVQTRKPLDDRAVRVEQLNLLARKIDHGADSTGLGRQAG